MYAGQPLTPTLSPHGGERERTFEHRCHALIPERAWRLNAFPLSPRSRGERARVRGVVRTCYRIILFKRWATHVTEETTP